MANRIVIEPKFNLGEDVWFIGNGNISSGEIVSINYCNYSSNATNKYKDEKIRDVSYGIKICINYFGNQYETIDIAEHKLYSSEVELAQHMLKRAEQR